MSRQSKSRRLVFASIAVVAIAIGGILLLHELLKDIPGPITGEPDTDEIFDELAGVLPHGEEEAARCLAERLDGDITDNELDDFLDSHNGYGVDSNAFDVLANESSNDVRNCLTEDPVLPRPTDGGDGRISEEEFNRLRTGMTYDEAVEVVGGYGTRRVFEGPLQNEIYEWPGIDDDTTAGMHVHDGAVVNIYSRGWGRPNPGVHDQP